MLQKVRNFPNIFAKQLKKSYDYYTLNAFPGLTHFNEDVLKIGGKEYRFVDKTRSKLFAAIAKNISQIGFKEGMTVLYLGASHGYTPSFVSDIVGSEGTVFALDFAPRVVRDLTFLAEKRKNIIPILGDANQPDSYAHLLSQVDIIFMDIAQKNQVEIFLKNMRFLKPGGFALLALKARSVDVTKKPSIIFDEVRFELESNILLVDNRVLDPFEKDHAFFVCKNKSPAKDFVPKPVKSSFGSRRIKDSGIKRGVSKKFDDRTSHNSRYRDNPSSRFSNESSRRGLSKSSFRKRR